MTEARLREQDAVQRQVPFARLQERTKPLELLTGKLTALETDVAVAEQEHSALEEREDGTRSTTP